MTATSQLRLTNADLEAMPEDGNRYEVIDGELYVSSAPSFFHQTTLFNILFVIGDYLRSNPIGRIVPGVGVILDEYNGVIPDLVFATSERMSKSLAGGRFVAPPELVIEILSPGHTNARRDRNVKLSLYAARGVAEYWIVDPENRCVEVYSRDAAGNLSLNRIFRQHDRLTSACLPGFTTPVEAFFA